MFSYINPFCKSKCHGSTIGGSNLMLLEYWELRINLTAQNLAAEKVGMYLNLQRVI